MVKSIFKTMNLSSWKLTLPVDSKETTLGTAIEIKTNLNNYSNSKFFTHASNGAVTFTAMAEGATTSGSKYARSELRELANGNNAAWTLKDGGTMTATLSVDRAPFWQDGTVGKMVVGQIHGKEKELVRLYWDNGNVYFVNDRAGSSTKETIYTLTDSKGNQPNISLGEQFSYRIETYNNKLTVEVISSGKSYLSTTDINPIWNTDVFYFKAGVYLGINEHTGSGIGQATFDAIDFSHVKGQGLGGLPSLLTSDQLAEILGSSGNDVLKGTESKDVIRGESGNDKIYGGDGNDKLYGGDGNDLIKGGAGNDWIRGGKGDDVLWGNEGNDVLIGGVGKDWLKGGEGKDTFKYTSLLDIGDIISDFQDGETIDISKLVDQFSKDAQNMNFGQLKAGGYLAIEDHAEGYVQIKIDTDGSHGQSAQVVLATVYGSEEIHNASSYIL